MLYFRHHGVQLGSFDEVYSGILVAFLVVLAQLCREGGVHDFTIVSRLESAIECADGCVSLKSLDDRFSLSARDELREVGGVILSEEEALFVAEEVFLIVIFEGEAGGGAGGGEAELVDYFFPEFVVGD